MNKNVLAIGAHPDDMEQFCGGILLLLKKAGWNITIAAMTDGACGSHEKSAQEIVKTRQEEAQSAAKMLGADYLNLGIADGCLEYNLDTAKKVAGLIRDVNPSIIFTHPVDDYMTDHWHTGKLVLWAVPESRHKNFQTSSKAAAVENQMWVYHTDPQGLTFADGQIARVNTVVDISDVVEKKLEAFAAHESQMEFAPHKENTTAVDKTRRWAIMRGEQVRIDYGEGFCQELHAEYPRRNILVDILGDKVFTL